MCCLTLIQECPYAHDPDHDNPPLLHEVGENDVPHKFKVSMSGISPFAGAASAAGAMAAALMSARHGLPGRTHWRRRG